MHSRQSNRHGGFRERSRQFFTTLASKLSSKRLRSSSTKRRAKSESPSSLTPHHFVHHTGQQQHSTTNERSPRGLIASNPNNSSLTIDRIDQEAPARPLVRSKSERLPSSSLSLDSTLPPPPVPERRRPRPPLKGQSDRKDTILARLEAVIQQPPSRCSICSNPMTDNDRYLLIDQLIHSDCYRCSKCGAKLKDRSSFCINSKWYCSSHFNNDIRALPGVKTEVD